MNEYKASYHLQLCIILDTASQNHSIDPALRKYVHTVKEPSFFPFSSRGEAWVSLMGLLGKMLVQVTFSYLANVTFSYVGQLFDTYTCEHPGVKDYL